MLVVGLPVWLRAWRWVQREAHRDDEGGDHARRSVVRRGYLYLVIFAGVMGIMFASGVLINEVLQAILGEPPEKLSLSVSKQVVLILGFGILQAYHWRVLRQDGRLAERSLSRRYAQFPVIILTPDEPEFAEALVDSLNQLTPGLPVAVQNSSQGAPDGTLAAARAVILPAELLARPSESVRLWLQGFGGARLVVPTVAEDWHWVTSGSQNLPALARQAARTVRQLAEGEPLRPPLASASWMAVVYFLAGLAMLGIFVLFISLVISAFD
jgi:hypothetical protein